MGRSRRWLWVALTAWAWPGLWLLRLWIRRRFRDRVFELEDCPKVDAVIILGAKLRADGLPTIALERRLEAASAALRSQKASRLVISADDGHRAGQDERSAMRDWLTARAVGPIELDPPVTRTMGSIEALRDRVQRGEVVALCSQRDHLYRALWLCDAADLSAIGVVARDGQRSQWLYGLYANAKAIGDVIKARRSAAAPRTPQP